MDTNKIKRFATEARNILKAGIAAKMLTLGFDKNGNVAEENKPQLMQGGSVWNGQLQTEGFYHQWMSLYNRIQQIGIKDVYEEAAYTWFNRLCAIRILQKNNLCSPVLAYADAARTPVIVDEARQGRYPHMKEEMRQRLMELLDDDTKVTEQFAILITAWCHENPIINRCFGGIADYTELLLPNNILAEGGFVDLLNHTEFITDDDFHSPELIGWLYQFYISERKDEVFAKKGKFEADEIPAATQIFTPNWIVKYMVQNTVGRIYLDNNPYETQLQKKWHYLVGDVSHVATAAGDVSHVAASSDANQTMCGGTPHPLNVSHVATAGISSLPSCGGTPHLLHYDELTDLKVADLACGSGHILNECFDLLYELYIAEGYSRSEAVENIFRHNLTGIDLDTRAKQLATFALLLNACQKDASFADAHCMPNVLDMSGVVPQLSKTEMKEACLQFIGGYEEVAGEMLEQDFELLRDADNLGSIMRFNDDKDYLNMLRAHYEDWTDGGIADCPDRIKQLLPGVRVILALTEKYHALVMNPPYMGGGNMNNVLSKYVKANYKNGKADLATVFVEMMGQRTTANGRYAFIIPPSWMFLSTFEGLRKNIIENQSIESLLHLSRGVFGADFGASSSVIKNAHEENARGTYFRLVKRTFQEFDQKHLRILFEQTLANHDFKYKFSDYTKDVTELPYSEDGNRIYYPNVEQKNFEKIPGCPIGYWLENNWGPIFEEYKPLGNKYAFKKGMSTGDNARFIRNWSEVSLQNITFSCSSNEESISLQQKWYPINYGGTYRKWYGNQWSVANWKHDGQEMKVNATILNHGGHWSRYITSTDCFFKSGLSWNAISSGNICVRFFEKGFIFCSASMCGYGDSILPVIGLLNSKVAMDVLKVFAPTMNYGPLQVKKIPLIEEIEKSEPFVQQNIAISKQDWDSHETSWDFQRNELLSIGDELVGDVSHVATAEMSTSPLCGGTPHPLNVSHVATSSDANQNMCGGTPHPLRFVNKNDYIHITINKLPHWNQGDCVQFVTFRLADSLPQAKLKEYGDAKEQWLAKHPKPWDIATMEKYEREVGSTMEKWIDAGYGECILKDEKIRNVVANAIMHFNGERYDIHAFVIMPNHVHVLLSTRDGNLVQNIVGSWKRFSAHEINKLLGRQGPVWERECFDHMVRNENSYNAKLDYIISNPAHLPSASYTLVGDVSHVAATVGDVSHVTSTVGDVSHVASTVGDVSHVASTAADVSHVASTSDNEHVMCGGTPHPLNFSLEDLVNKYKQKWERKFMQLHANEEELNRQFIDIYGLEDELTPDVPLDEITILQQGEISIE